MKRFSILLFLFSASLSAQYARMQFLLQNAQGQAISGASVYVYSQTACGAAAGALATIYPSANGGTPTQQPLHTNGKGEAHTYAAPGCYTVVYNSPSTGTQTYPDQIVGGNGPQGPPGPQGIPGAGNIFASGQYSMMFQPLSGSQQAAQGDPGIKSDGAGSLQAKVGFGTGIASQWQAGSGNNGIAQCFNAGKPWCVADPTYALTEQYAFFSRIPNLGSATFVDQRSGMSTYSHNWQTLSKNFGTNSAIFDYCLRETWIPLAGFSGHSSCHDEYYTDTTPGWSFGNGGTSTTGWYIPIQKILYLTVNGSGISMDTNQTLAKYGAGDSITEYLYNLGMNGYTAASDEGGKVLGMGMIESTLNYTGTCQNGCTSGSTLVKTAAVTGAGSQGTDRYLIDTSQAPTTGKVTNIAAGLSGSGGSALTVTATVPVSNAWGTITTPNPATPVNPQPPFSTSETFNITVTSGTFDTTHVLCFANHYHECTIPTSVTNPAGPTATIVMPVRKGHITGDAICQGGVAGYTLEMTSYSQGAVKYPFDAWCSTGANTVQAMFWNTSAAQAVPFTSAIYNISNLSGLTNELACTAVGNGTGVYTCTVPAGANGLNPYNGKSITFSTFAQGANNGTFTITSTTATTITTNNASSVTDTTGIGTTTVMNATYVPAGSTLFSPNSQTKGTFAIASASDSQLNGNCNNVVWSSSTVLTCNASSIVDTASHTAATATAANSNPGAIVGLNNFNLWPMAQVLDVQNEIGPFTLSAAGNTAGGNTTYTGTGLTNACPSASVFQYSVTGFTNAGNNVTSVNCVSSTATTLVLVNSGGVSETSSATAGIANRLDGTLALEPNAMPFAPGDTLELTHLSPAKYQAYTANTAVANPWAIHYGMAMGIQGAGAVGGSNSAASNARISFSNLQPDSTYRGLGTGNQNASNIFNAGGAYNYGFVFDHGPQNGASLFNLVLVPAQSNDVNYSYFPFFFGNKSGQTYMQITPSTGNTTIRTQTKGVLALLGDEGMTIGENGQSTTFASGSTVNFTGATVSGLGGTAWNGLTAPSGNLALSMGNNVTTMTYGTATVGNMWTMTDGVGNSGGGAVLALNTNGTSSALPLIIAAKGTTFYTFQNNGTLNTAGGAQINICPTCAQTFLATTATAGANHGTGNFTQNVSVWNGSAAIAGNCTQSTAQVSSSASNSNSYWQLNCTAPTGTTMEARIAGVTDLLVPAVISSGTRFTATGCTSITSPVGGAAAGKFTIGASGCTVVITMNGATGITAPNGWSCHANDETTAAGNTGLYFSANNATTATLTVPAGALANDVIDFGCLGY